MPSRDVRTTNPVESETARRVLERASLLADPAAMRRCRQGRSQSRSIIVMRKLAIEGVNPVESTADVQRRFRNLFL